MPPATDTAETSLNIPYWMILGQAVVEVEVAENQVVEEPKVVVSGVKVVEMEVVGLRFQAEKVAKMIKVVVQLGEEPAGYKAALEFPVSEQVESQKQV